MTEQSEIARIAAGLTEAQREAITVPHLLVIDNMQCVPDLGWPKEMVAYQWSQYDTLSELGLAVRALLEQEQL